MSPPQHGLGYDLNLNRCSADRAGRTRVPKEEAAEGVDEEMCGKGLWEFLLSLPDDLHWEDQELAQQSQILKKSS